MAKKSLNELLGGVKQFGLYMVTGEGRADRKARYAACRCGCGKIVDVDVKRLLSGRSTRCKDCAKKSPERVTNLKHGRSGSVEYDAWRAMRYRCGNPSCWNFPDYGGRGITVCKEWDESFEAFLADMGPRPDGWSLDRINNDQGYYPRNCRWASKKEQQRNRRVTKTVSWQGKDRTLSELEAEFGLPRSVLSLRLGLGWTLERALKEPALIKKPKHQVFGKTMTTKEICAEYGINRQTFNWRIRQGWTAEQTVNHYSS